jgi:hypothetical protein
MNDERIRLQIGFEGGMVISVSVLEEEADRLERHLASGGDGAVELNDEDGRFVVVVPRVLFVKRFSRESRVGFGA